MISRLVDFTGHDGSSSSAAFDDAEGAKTLLKRHGCYVSTFFGSSGKK